MESIETTKTIRMNLIVHTTYIGTGLLVYELNNMLIHTR